MISKIKNLTRKKILVVGDVMIDSYIEGVVTRISPEAPVPVLSNCKKRIVLGGAANVAANLIGSKQNVYLSSVIGMDTKAKSFKKMCLDLGIDCSLIFQSSKRTTTEKTRFIGQSNQQILRFDVEDSTPLSRDDENSFISLIINSIPNFDLIILSDYNKGVLTEKICQLIIDICQKNQIKVLFDMKEKNLNKYKHSFLIKPNRKELGELTNLPVVTNDQIIDASIWLRNKCKVNYVLTTMGGNGMLLIGKNNKSILFPAYKREVFDVSGAGDTVIAYLGACLANKFDLKESLDISSMAAAIQVGKIGTSIVYYDSVVRELSREKIGYSKLITIDDFQSIRDPIKKVVFTNGCFDILHAGHVSYLQKAKELGDILVVGLNSDKSIKRIKGPTRPINSEKDRAAVLSSLKCVDFVIIFNEDTPDRIIKQIHPDILVKGADYKNKEIVGKTFVESYNGKVELIPFVKGKSTTKIIERIEKAKNEKQFRNNQK